MGYGATWPSCRWGGGTELTGSIWESEGGGGKGGESGKWCGHAEISSSSWLVVYCCRFALGSSWWDCSKPESPEATKAGINLKSSDLLCSAELISPSDGCGNRLDIMGMLSDSSKGPGVVGGRAGSLAVLCVKGKRTFVGWADGCWISASVCCCCMSGSFCCSCCVTPESDRWMSTSGRRASRAGSEMVCIWKLDGSMFDWWRGGEGICKGQESSISLSLDRM